MTERFVGATPADALEAFSNEYCRRDEREMKTYAYRDRHIQPVTEQDTAVVASFRVTRREDSSHVVVREYSGLIREPPDGAYVVDDWEMAVVSEARSPKPPGETPPRLRGRRPRDRYHRVLCWIFKLPEGTPGPESEPQHDQRPTTTRGARRLAGSLVQGNL